MSLLRNTVLVVASSFVFVVGCSSSGPGSENTQTLTGNLGSGSTSAKSYGGISVRNGTAGLHVVAREVHKQGVVAKKIDAVVDASGAFRLDVVRGSKYVVMVESADKKSAMITLGNKNNVLTIGTSGNGAAIDFGRLHLVGGEARTSVSIDGSTGVAIGAADLDDVFEDVNGALKNAADAVAEAEKAAAEALKESQEAIDEANKAAEEARKAAAAAAAAAGR